MYSYTSKNTHTTLLGYGSDHRILGNVWAMIWGQNTQGERGRQDLDHETQWKRFNAYGLYKNTSRSRDTPSYLAPSKQLDR